MLRTLHVENFRALREFRMKGLGRVNLLVGTNNCGKTSVLEALHLLLAPEGPHAIWRSLLRRGEYGDTPSGRELEIAHLFHGHRADLSDLFSVAGEGDDSSRRVNALIRPISSRDAGSIQFLWRQARDESAEPPSQMFEVVWHRGEHQTSVLDWPMWQRGTVDHSRSMLTPRAVSSTEGVQFVSSEGLSPADTVDLFDGVVLTPDEGFVLGALRTIEPALERVASVGPREPGAKTRTRGGLAAMVAGQRVPIGSMGDGIWRLLGIALTLVRARGGALLIDEIDTGLHYTVLEKMWRLVFETAERLNVQVFATTHSRDCYEALAAITQPDRHEVSIQRIERGRIDAVSFDEGAISAAAARDIEVR